MSKTPDEIAALVAQALRDTLASEDYPERLEPFTEAQLRFLRQFVAQAIVKVLTE